MDSSFCHITTPRAKPRRCRSSLVRSLPRPVAASKEQFNPFLQVCSSLRSLQEVISQLFQERVFISDLSPFLAEVQQSRSALPVYSTFKTQAIPVRSCILPNRGNSRSRNSLEQRSLRGEGCSSVLNRPCTPIWVDPTERRRGGPSMAVQRGNGTIERIIDEIPSDGGAIQDPVFKLSPMPRGQPSQQ